MPQPVFDPDVVHTCAMDAVGKPKPEMFDVFADAMDARYPSVLDRTQPWIYSIAGGAMIQMKLYYASLTEYIMIWGTPIGSEGHSGRHRVGFWDTVIDGEMWYFAEGEFEKRIYTSGDRVYVGPGQACGMNFTNGVWAVEYARGTIPLSLPFGLADEILSCVDFKTAAQTVSLYTDLVSQALGHQLLRALGPGNTTARLLTGALSGTAKRITHALEAPRTLQQMPRDNPRWCFRERYGPWALVAGASEGIGAEFGRQLAAKGLNLVLLARTASTLEATAEKLRREYGIEVRALAVDLARQQDLDAVLNATSAVDVGLLVCNAAMAPIGLFHDRALDEHLATIDLNCRAAVILVHAFGTRMVARRRGGIVLLSSLAGLQGTAMTAHYAATKAYLRVLAEGLWDELRPRGVDVIACVAGATETPAYRASKPREKQVAGARFPPVQPASEVVRETLATIGRAPVCVPGIVNRAVSFLVRRVLPTAVAVRAVSATTRKMYGAPMR